MARPKGTGKIAKALTLKEIVSIDKYLVGTRYELRNRALFHLGLGSGMRIAEMLSIRVKDISPCDIILGNRIVPINDSARIHLMSWLNSRDTLNGESPLFPSQKYPHQPMRIVYVVQMFSEIFIKAGVPSASTHSMRKTFIMDLVNSGEDIEEIQDRVGLQFGSIVKYLKRRKSKSRVIKCRSYPSARAIRVQTP